MNKHNMVHKPNETLYIHKEKQNHNIYRNAYVLNVYKYHMFSLIYKSKIKIDIYMYACRKQTRKIERKKN